MGSRNRRMQFCFSLSVFLRAAAFSFTSRGQFRSRKGGGMCRFFFCLFFFLPGLCHRETRWWWWVYAGSPSLTVIGVSRGDMAGHNGLSDNRRDMYGRSDRLGNNMSRCNYRGMRDDRRSDDRRGDDRAGTMAEGKAGQTTGMSEGDSQDGSEDSLWRRLSNEFIKMSFSLELIVRVCQWSMYSPVKFIFIESWPYRKIDAIKNYLRKNHSEYSSGYSKIAFSRSYRIIPREHGIDRIKKKYSARAAFHTDLTMYMLEWFRSHRFFAGKRS